MYEEFYGLKTKPFQMVPDPAFLYWSQAHQMAFTMLQYGLLNASPLTVITGDVGTGKTTLMRQLLEDFPNELTVGLISNIQAGKGDLLEWALMAFEQSYDGGHVDRFHRFERFVIDSYAQGRQVALIIDEAHNLGVEQLEELRMLSNVNAEKDLLLQIILIGQPELREKLALPELRQFSQRITSDFHLETLTAHEVEPYIARRLEVAGATWRIFPPETCEKIFNVTRGVPRLINVLCDLCLVYAFSSEKHVVDVETMRDLMGGIEKNGIFNQFSPMDPPEAKEETPEPDRFDSSVKPFPTKTG